MSPSKSTNLTPSYAVIQGLYWMYFAADVYKRQNMYIVVDMELKGRIRAALIKAILGFEVRVK